MNGICSQSIRKIAQYRSYLPAKQDPSTMDHMFIKFSWDLQCLQLNIKLNTMCSTRSGSWSSAHHNIPSLCCQKKKSTPHSTQTPLAANRHAAPRRSWAAQRRLDSPKWNQITPDRSAFSLATMMAISRGSIPARVVVLCICSINFALRNRPDLGMGHWNLPSYYATLQMQWEQQQRNLFQMNRLQ